MQGTRHSRRMLDATLQRNSRCLADRHRRALHWMHRESIAFRVPMFQVMQIHTRAAPPRLTHRSSRRRARSARSRRAGRPCGRRAGGRGYVASRKFSKVPGDESVPGSDPPAVRESPRKPGHGPEGITMSAAINRRQAPSGSSEWRGPSRQRGRVRRRRGAPGAPGGPARRCGACSTTTRSAPAARPAWWPAARPMACRRHGALRGSLAHAGGPQREDQEHHQALRGADGGGSPSSKSSACTASIPPV